MPAPQKTGKPQKWELARALRRDGMTLGDIAEKLNVNPRTVEKWSASGKLAWNKPPTSADDGTGVSDADLPFEAGS